jgi:hypothetical protein
MIEEGTIGTQLSNEKWVRVLTFFVDITTYLDDFDTQLQQK